MYRICNNMDYTIRKGIEMAKRDGITYEQVAAVADKMVGEGDDPTIRAVRETLGTGSPNTIHRHLTAWRAARPVAVAAAAELPAALTAAIAAEINKAAAAARGKIEDELVKGRSEAADLAAAGEALEAERDNLAEQVAALTTERDAALATATERAAEISRLAEAVTREQAAAESARLEVATVRLKIESLAEKTGEQAEEIARLRAAFEDSRQARTAAEQGAAVANAKLDAAERRAAAAEARETALRQQHQEELERLTRLAEKAQSGMERALAQARQENRKPQDGSKVEKLAPPPSVGD